MANARLILGAALCVISAAFLAREEAHGTFAKAEEVWVEWLLTNSPGAIQEPEVTFVQIDDTEDRIFESWPLSPGDYTLVLENLKAFSPRVVGIAPALRWEERGMLFDSLITELDALPRPVLGTELGFIEEERDLIDPAIESMFEAIPGVVGDIDQVPRVTTILDLPQDAVRRDRPIGFTRLETEIERASSESEGKLKLPLVARYGDDILPGFVLQLAMSHLEVGVDDVDVSLGRWIRVGDRQIPIDATGAMEIDPEIRASIPRVNASALLLGPDPDPAALSSGEGAALASLRTNAVVLGIDAPDSRTIALADGVEPDQMISSADLLATALAAIQGRRHIRELELPGRILLWVLVGILAGSLFAFRRRGVLKVGLLSLVGVATVGLLVFQGLKLWSSPIVPIGTLLVALVGAYVTGAEPSLDETESAES